MLRRNRCNYSNIWIQISPKLRNIARPIRAKLLNYHLRLGFGGSFYPSSRSLKNPTPFQKTARISRKINPQNRQRRTQVRVVIPRMESHAIFFVQKRRDRQLGASFSNRTRHNNQLNFRMAREIFFNVFFKFFSNSFLKHNLHNYNIKSPLFQAVISFCWCAPTLGRLFYFCFCYKCYLGDE